MVLKKLFEVIKKIYNRSYSRCKAYHKEHYFDCWGIIVEANRLLPVSYYYLYSKDEIAKMEAELWKEMEEKIKKL